MKNHNEIKELLIPFVLGELSQEQASHITQHLLECQECSTEVRRLGKILECARQTEDLEADEQLCQSAEQAALKAAEGYGERALRPTIKREAVWRIIMESRITKLTAAAVVIIAVTLGIYTFMGNGASVALARVVDNMKKMPWMHGIGRFVQGDKELQYEKWVSHISKIRITKHWSGKVTFSDYAKHREYEYDPEFQAVNIRYIADFDYKCAGLDSPYHMLEYFKKYALDHGGSVERRSGQYEGETVDIYEISWPVESQIQIGKIYVNTGRHLPMAAEISVSEPNGAIIGTGNLSFDYPEQGPSDIYEVGVPLTAKVIDKVPPLDFLNLYEAYKKHRRAISRYISIMTSADADGVIKRVNVIFCKGRTTRLESHSVFKPGDAIYSMWPKYKAQMGSGFEDLFNWAQAQKSSSVKISIYDGEYDSQVERDYQGNWSQLTKSYHPSRSLCITTDLQRVGWPRIWGKIVENKYANENGLVCVEHFHKPETKNDGINRPPTKTLYYLNPQRDYICQRKERYQYLKPHNSMPDLSDYDANDLHSYLSYIREVTKYAQTETGQWYPKKITYRSSDSDVHSPLNLSETITVYLELDAEFPHGIFDPQNLSNSGK